MKTSELTGAALDWAVTKIEAERKRFTIYPEYMTDYSTNWAHGGPIIEREAINLRALGSALWEAETWSAGGDQYLLDGTTPLIAAMRCYVASKLGDEVQLPEDL
ncbi:Bacteriophage P22, NinX [uncultured Caudovirales phage]|uniref:Bacteriophage P22, NinX n=1 Tax=uncultured Caudovirales phage TaxID=2100421 RepID=A0A6J5NHM5_9CAUD|nr:Bacteriophage P22, NinX [uncultured Caudovirales phage]